MVDYLPAILMFLLICVPLGIACYKVTRFNPPSSADILREIQQKK